MISTRLGSVTMRVPLETRSNNMTDLDALKTSFGEKRALRDNDNLAGTSRTVIEAFVFAMRQVATSIPGILSVNKR
jgi:hypothetical protein